MKKFEVTWVEKAYYTTTVEAESQEAASEKVEADFDSFFLSKRPVDYDNEVLYKEI